MIVLLPPSETKVDGGDVARPLDLSLLVAPELTGMRTTLLDTLIDLAVDPAASRTALGLGPAQDGEIARNAALRTAPTMPAIERYTGVLYDALDVASLTGAAAARARRRLMVCSALFGLLRADDPVPAYRLSAGGRLPGGPGLAARWRPVLTPALAGLAARELVVDLRSGAYATLAPLPGAVTVDVVAQRADGSRAVVSHANKATKGRLARALAAGRADAGDAAKVASLARRAGMVVERSGDALTVIVD